jgi:hypothetical protein
LIQKGLEIRTITGVDKKQYDVALAHVENTDGLGGDYPLMIMVDGKWTEMTPSKLYSINNWLLELAFATYKHEQNGTWTYLLGNETYAQLVKDSCTRILITGEMDTNWVFQNFKKSDWDKVLQNWDQIKAQLDKKEIPTGFDYNWKGSEDFVKFATDNHKSIRASMISDTDVPKDFNSYQPKDIKKLLEYIVKARVIKFPQVESWNLPNEMVERSIYGGNNEFWAGGKLKALDSTKLMAQFIKEINRNARLILVDDSVLENFPSADFDVKYFAFVDSLLQAGVQIDALTFENNLWIYDPIDPAKVNKVFNEAAKRGMPIEGAETTVAISPIFPSWTDRPKTINLGDANPLRIQAEMYAEMSTLYFENGSKSFGFGNLEDENSWQARSTGYPESSPGLIANIAGQKKASWYTFMLAGFKYVK